MPDVDSVRASGAESDRHGAGAEGSLRRILLWLVVFGSLGLLLELALLEHVESVQQWIPLAVLALGLGATLLALARPSPMRLNILRAAMLLGVLTAIAGLYLHYGGNAAFEREMDPEARGLALVWLALRGATPALAPGAMAQLGLLGLLAAHRHPASRATAGHARSRPHRGRDSGGDRS